MMKLLVFLLSVAMLSACGGNDNKSDTKESNSTSTSTTTTNDRTQHPDYKAGLAIEAKSDCATCHRINERVQGPAYKEIANKYAGSDTAVDYLAKKIISGGSGVWGEIIMTPHPTLSEEEAKTLARYVLLMKD